MKNIVRFLVVVALVAAIGFLAVSCTAGCECPDMSCPSKCSENKCPDKC